jgi:hypothetical protein
VQTLTQVRIGFRHTLVHPELNPRNSLFGCFQQVRQHRGITAEDIGCEAETVSEGDYEIHISCTVARIHGEFAVVVGNWEGRRLGKRGSRKGHIRFGPCELS